MKHSPILAAAFVAVAALSSCGAGKTALLRTSEVAPGTECAQGGVRVETGLDADGNGALGDGEVDAAQSRVVCSGATGPSGAAGATGPTGVTGPTGAEGASGTGALIAMTAEPAGVHCIYGGQRVDGGVDANRDGTLQPGEVTSTQYVCDPNPPSTVFRGDFTVTTLADLVRLNQYTEVTGSLGFASGLGASVRVSTLKSVGGRVGFNPNSQLTAITFDALESAERVEVISSTELTSLSLPRYARGALHVVGCTKLTSLDAPALTAGEVLFIDDPALTTLSLPSLTQTTRLWLTRTGVVKFDAAKLALATEDLQFDHNAALTEIWMPSLGKSARIDVTGNAVLRSFVVPNLEVAGGTLTLWGSALPVLSLPRMRIGSLDIADEPALTLVSAPVMTFLGSLRLARNPVLVTVDLPQVEASDGFLEVTGCPQFDTCAAWRLAARALALRSATVTGNKAATCLPTDTCASRAVLGLPGTVTWCVQPLAYAAARSTCQAQGGGSDLLWFNTQAEWNAYQLAASQGVAPGNGWLGYSDQAVEGTWVPTVGGFTPAAATFWSPGKPAGGAPMNSAELLSDLATGVRVGDAPATALKPPVCRKP